MSKLLLSSPIELFQLFVDIDLISFHFFNFFDCYALPLASALFITYVFFLKYSSQLEQQGQQEPHSLARAQQGQQEPRRADVGLVKAVQGQCKPFRCDADPYWATQRLTQAS